MADRPETAGRHQPERLNESAPNPSRRGALGGDALGKALGGQTIPLHGRIAESREFEKQIGRGKCRR
jgi:hypothetical protein